MKTKRIANQILKPYKKIVKEIVGNYTDIRVTIGKTFCCYCKPEYDLEIEIPIFEDILGHKAFYEKMNRRLQEYNIKGSYSAEILSILHELGHIYTYNALNDKLYIIGTNFITRLQGTFIFRNSLRLTNFCFRWYFNLALERNADKWAMVYIKNHQEQVQEWQELLEKNYKKTLPKLLDKMGLEVM